MLQKLSDHAVERCEQCDSPAERIISKTSFQLKGSGWYVTDYANKSKGSSSSSGAGSAAGEKVKSEGSTPSADSSKAPETKPAEKSEAKKD